MDAIGPLRQRLRALIRSERGMALPTAIFAMIASMGLATAAVVASVDVQRGSKRDSGSKNAIAAADAGAGVALLRLNRFHNSLSNANPCVGPAGESLTPTAGWCPSLGPESVGSASYTYRVSAYEQDAPVSVVSIGTASGVSRRVEVGLISFAGEEIFANEGLIGEAGITLEGSPDVRTNIGTNGNVEKNNGDNGNATVCGDIRHGVGKEGPEPDCDGETTEGNKSLPEITPPEDIATNNWNCRLSKTIDTNCPTAGDYDPYIGANGKEKRTSDEPWDEETRTINITGNSTLTMGGQDYFVCRLIATNGELIMASGANVRIFFDTPENCGLKDGDTQVAITGNAIIKSTGFNPPEGSFALPGLYLLGSPTITTQVKLTGGAQTDRNEIMLYAPYSDVEIGGNATWLGLVAGETLRMHGTATIESDPGIDGPDITYSSLWERTNYVECVGATGSPPDANC